MLKNPSNKIFKAHETKLSTSLMTMPSIKNPTQFTVKILSENTTTSIIKAIILECAFNVDNINMTTV
jgi:hypothetical protein